MIKKDLLDKGVQRLGLKKLQSFSNEGTRTFLGVQFLEVQWLCLWASHAGDTTPTLGHRVNILHTIQHRKNISNADTSVTKVCELHSG